MPVFVWLFSLLAMILLFPPEIPGYGLSKNVLFAIGLGTAIAAFVIGSMISKADVELTMDENGISRKWIRRFRLQKRTVDQLNWDEIEQYLFEPSDRYTSVLRIRTHGRKHLSLSHEKSEDGADDFLRFVKDFERNVEMYNARLRSERLDAEKTEDPPTPRIRREPTRYEEPFALVMAIIGILLLVSIPFVFYFAPQNNSAATIGLSAAAAGTIWYILQVYRHRKKWRAP